MGISQSKEEAERERRLKIQAEAHANFLRREAELQRQCELEKERKRIWLLHNERELIRKIQSLSLADEQENNKVHIKEISKNPRMIQDLLKSIGCETWTNKVLDNAYILENIDNTSSEFQILKKKFTGTNKQCFKLKNIEKVYNPYLFLHFKLKEHESRYRWNPFETKKFFHGTKSHCIDGICENNFNWRLSGSSTGHKFGQGISFTPIANYATHYGDKKSYEKIMFLADVQVGECCYGDIDTVIPDGSADTTVNEQESVYVKYEDNAFYPTYILHYEGFDSQKKNKSYFIQ